MSLEFDPLAVVEQELAIVEERNPRFRALVHIDAGEARRAAEALRRGDWAGLMQGLSVVVKDCVHVAGMPSSDGMPDEPRHAENHDAEAIRRLRQNGAVVFAKSNLAELTYSVKNENRFFGDCLNPWDPARIPGGSSGGSAAAVASGMCRIGIGTDTGGSIRIPAALCGIAGLRPSVGRVSTDGLLGLSVGYDTIGPMAYSVADVARAFAAMAGNGQAMEGVPVLENFLGTLNEGIAGLRIGIPRNFYFDTADAAVVGRVMEAAKVLEACGATLVDVHVPQAEEAQSNVVYIIGADAIDTHHERLENRRDGIEPGILDRLRFGMAVTGAQYSHALRWVEAWKAGLRALFREVDMVLTPATPSVAPRFDQAGDLVTSTRRLTSLTYGFSASDTPGLSVPCGFVDGMPVGMLLTGPRFADAALLRAGIAYQARTEFHHARPRWPL